MSGAFAQGNEKVIPKRKQYPSDDARRATEVAIIQGDESRKAQDAFREKFVSEGRDLGALPPANIPTQYYGPSTLAQAVARASGGVVVANVTGQEILDGWVVSTISVKDVLRGQPPGSAQVRQVGGPVDQDGVAYAAQLETEPLLKMGRTYLLFLGQCTPSAPVPSPDAYCVGGKNGSEFALAADGSVESWSDGFWVVAYDGVPLEQLKADIARVTP
jgi:hypothetical protein